MRAILWGTTLLLTACAAAKDETVDTDTGRIDTDLVDTDGFDTDVLDSGGTGLDPDTDDTDVVDSDGAHVVLHGQLFCELPTPSKPDGVPATPGFAKITIVQPWNCPPLSGCNENTNVEILAQANVDASGVFDLDFQTGPYRVDELYLYTNNKDGVCGNGYQFTQNALTSYADWTHVIIDVDSIFF